MNRWIILLLALLLAACGSPSAEPAPATEVPTPAEPVGPLPSLATVGPSGGGAALQTGENEGSSNATTPVPATGGETFVGQLDVPFGPGGRRYEFELRIPEAWRGRYEVAAEGANGATFFLIEGEARAPLFTLLAFTDEAWAEQQGQPGAGSVLSALDSSTFVVQLAPGDDPSGATLADYATFLAAAPEVLQSFSVQRAPP